MKSNKEFRGKGYDHGTDENVKKAVKLPPIKKSGKERHQMLSSLEEEDDPELEYFRKTESVLDYFDDAEEDL